MQLTNEQLTILDRVKDFYLNDERTMVISGSAGTGKSVLIENVVSELSDIAKALKTVGANTLNIHVTASTNPAVEVLLGKNLDATTIHKKAKIFPTPISNRSKTNTESYEVHENNPKKCLYIIDEAFMLDKEFITKLYKHSHAKTKFLFIGDPYQLPPVGEMDSILQRVPANHCYQLTQIMRQNNQDLMDSIILLKNAVINNTFPNVSYNSNVIALSQQDFTDLYLENIKANTGIYLGYSNADVFNVAKFAQEKLYNTAAPKKGDFVIIPYPQNELRNNQILAVVDVDSAMTNSWNVDGYNMKLSNGKTYFRPNNYKDISKIVNYLKSKIYEMQSNQNICGGYKQMLHDVNETWVDCRLRYSSTINKSQGQSFENVFINLSSYKSLTNQSNWNMLARLLYVAFSRATNKVYITGAL